MSLSCYWLAHVTWNQVVARIVTSFSAAFRIILLDRTNLSAKSIFWPTCLQRKTLEKTPRPWMHQWSIKVAMPNVDTNRSHQEVKRFFEQSVNCLHAFPTHGCVAYRDIMWYRLDIWMHHNTSVVSLDCNDCSCNIHAHYTCLVIFLLQLIMHCQRAPEWWKCITPLYII